MASSNVLPNEYKTIGILTKSKNSLATEQGIRGTNGSGAGATKPSQAGQGVPRVNAKLIVRSS